MRSCSRRASASTARWCDRRVCVGLAVFGIALDDGRNERSELVISADGATTQVLVVPTDEEHAIAEQTAGVVASRLRTDLGGTGHRNLDTNVGGGDESGVNRVGQWWPTPWTTTGHSA